MPRPKPLAETRDEKSRGGVSSPEPVMEADETSLSADESATGAQKAALVFTAFFNPAA